MDENKTMQNQNPDGAGETTFTQEQVNKIVSDRLAREKVKSEAALAEREQQLAQRELLLTAKEKLTESGLPVELLDALNVSSPEAMDKAITTLKGVIGILDGMTVQKIPANRLPAGFGFMIAHPCATVAPTKLEDYTIHENPPGISGSLVEGRICYDAFTLDNKVKAVYYQAQPSTGTEE